jgi:WD40 repeat protein
VRPERLIAQRLIGRLDREFSYHLRVEAILWEREPLLATEHFQASITPPHETDIVVVILWSRLGVPLPVDRYLGPVSGRPVTGTEWEFEDAVASYRTRRVPDLLLYRKQAPISAFLDDEAILDQQREQKRLVDDFFRRWFIDSNAGTFTAASREFASTAEFEELLETQLRELLLRRLQGEVEADAIRWPGSPFRGLQSFEPEHAQVFFGRIRARNELRELLGRSIASGCAFVLVLGASGSGKSSLVKAGLLPDLQMPGIIGRVALCRYAIFRPGNSEGDLLGSLADAILSPTSLPELTAAPFAYSRAHLAALLRSVPAEAAVPIGQGLGLASAAAQLTEHAEARLLLLIDQLEELFTLDGLSQEDRTTFVSALEGLARSGRVWVVATMRSDFFDRLESLPALARLSAGARYLLTSPDSAELGQIIRQPAREAGLRFEADPEVGQSLDDVLLGDASQAAAPLPLLEFALEQLWHRRGPRGELTFAAYRELGGLEGALGRRAEEEFGHLAPEVQAALDVVLRALATVGQGTGSAITARPAVFSSFPPGTPARSLVEAFLSERARLLVAEAADDGARVRVAHEALLTRWDRASRLLARDRSDLQVRARLEEGATRWASAAMPDRDSLLLRPGLPLAEAQDLLRRRPEALSDTVVEYIRTSDDVARAQQRRRRKYLSAVVAVFAVLTVLAGIAAGIAWRQSLAAQQQSRIAIARQIAAEALADLSTTPRRSLLLAVQSIALEQMEPTFDASAALRLLHTILSGVGGLPMLGHTGPVLVTAFSPDGKWLATAGDDGTIRLWRPLSASDPPVVLRGHRGAVTALAFSPDGKWVATGGKDGTVILRALTDPEHPITLRGHREALSEVVFSTVGNWLATGDTQGVVRLWDISRAPAIPNPIDLTSFRAKVTGLSFSADGLRLVGASYDGTALIWDISDGKPSDPPQRLTHGKDGILAMALSSDGNQLAIARAYTVELWNLTRTNEAAAEPAVLAEAKQWVVAIAFSANGRWLAAGGIDNLVRLWDLTAHPGTPPAVLREHTAAIRTITFSPDIRWLVTAGQDATVRLWDLSDSTFPSITLRGHEGTINVVIADALGRHLATASDDGTARLWTIPDTAADPTVLHDPDPHELGCAGGANDCTAIDVVAFSHDGKHLASGGRGKAIRLWRLTNPPVSETALTGQGSNISAMAFSPDDRWLAAISINRSGLAWLWDLANPNAVPRPIVMSGHRGAISSMAVSRDGRWFATGSWDRTIHVWDLTTQLSAEPHFVLSGHQAAVRALAFSDDGTRLISGSGDPSSRETLAIVWDLTASDPGAHRIVLHGHRDIVANVALSPGSGRFAATASWDKTARVWDLQAADPSAKPRVLNFEDRVGSISFSPDGQFLAAASWDKQTQVLDLRNPTALPVSLPGPQGRILDMHFSPNGSWLASASEDSSIWLWNVADLKREAVVLHGHSGQIAFSPGGLLLASGTPDEPATRIWSLKLADLLTAACRTAGRNLTEAEWHRSLSQMPYRQTCAPDPGHRF